MYAQGDVHFFEVGVLGYPKLDGGEFPFCVRDERDVERVLFVVEVSTEEARSRSWIQEK